MRVLLRYSRTAPVLKISLIYFFTDSPTRSQKHWKNLACRPSGPGALNFLSAHKVAKILLLETCLSKFRESASFK